jgi:hypothetical protein
LKPGHFVGFEVEDFFYHIFVGDGMIRQLRDHMMRTRLIERCGQEKYFSSFWTNGNIPEIKVCPRTLLRCKFCITGEA